MDNPVLYLDGDSTDWDEDKKRRNASHKIQSLIKNQDFGSRLAA